MPFLGSSYLGLRAGSPEEEWQRKAVPISALMLATMSLPSVVHFSLAPLLFMGCAWLMVAIISVISLWRQVLFRKAKIAAAAGGVTTLIFVLNIIIFGYAAVSYRIDWPEITVFKAPETTPTVAAGEFLYGMKYEALTRDDGVLNHDHNIRIQRGQLVLAQVEGQESLVRVLAVEGDIFKVEPGTLFINGAKATVGGRFEPGDRYDLARMVEEISLLGEFAGYDAMMELARTRARVIGVKQVVVARDRDLLNSPAETVPTFDLTDNDIIALPWAKFWSLDDYPGKQSKLVQPSVVFID